MTDMHSLFPANGPVSKDALRRHLPGPVANVQGFGAKGDGVADDTPAIQAAIDEIGRAGGGIVYLPAGNYRIQPQASVAVDRLRAHALHVGWDNVTLRGDGAALTNLLFRTLGGGDPTTQYELSRWYEDDPRRAVWRGSALFIVGGETAQTARRNITIEDLAIDGGVRPGNNGDRTWPANETAPGGWDISHKGIYIQEDKHHRRIVVRNVHAHDFRGEIIYGGGKFIDDLVIEGCELHATNGDCISFSASAVVRDNHLYDAAHACVENFHYAKEARYLNNRVERARFGFNIQTAWDSPFPCIVSGNVFSDCSEYGLFFNIENGATFISENTFVDCGYGLPHHAAILLSPGKKGLSGPIINGVMIRNNTILRQTKDGGVGVSIGCDAGCKLKSIVVSENFIGSSGPAIERNLRFLAPIVYSYIKGAEVDGVFISKNIFFRTQRHVENTLAHLPELGGPMPLMWDNQAIGFNDAANTTAISDGLKPIRLQNEGPISLQSGRGDGELVPRLLPSDYSQGQKISLTNANIERKVYIPQSSDIYACRVGRYLVPGVYLTLMRDGDKMREVAFEDRRSRPYAEVIDGNIIAADGFDEVYISVPSERRFTGFSGIGHGAQIRIIATNNNATIAHGGDIKLHADSDYAMRENEVKLFMRTRDGILREI